MSVSLIGVGHAFTRSDFLFAGVTRSFDRGAVCAVVGPSGSGKSTLLGIIAGMIVPTLGSVERAEDTAVGWVFQNPHGAPRRSVIDHVTLPLIAHGRTRLDADTAAFRLLDEFGLAARARAQFSELSGGEAQRLLLARGIAAAPDVLLVDEPTAQLDRSTAAQVNGAIGALACRGTAVVVATHDAATRDACTEVLDLAGHRS